MLFLFIYLFSIEVDMIVQRCFPSPGTSLASSLEVDVSKEKGIFTTDLEGDQTTSPGYDLPSNNLHANLKNIEDHTSNNNFNYILPPNDSDSDSGMDNLAYKL